MLSQCVNENGLCCVSWLLMGTDTDLALRTKCKLDIWLALCRANWRTNKAPRTNSGIHRLLDACVELALREANGGSNKARELQRDHKMLQAVRTSCWVLA